MIFLLTKVGALQTPEQGAALNQKLNSVFPNRTRDLGAGAFLISVPQVMTSKDVGTAIDLGEGQFGSYIITPVPAYWGYADRSIWEWITIMGATDGQS